MMQWFFSLFKEDETKPELVELTDVPDEIYNNLADSVQLELPFKD